jgi:3-oxoacyl-[acyl-carrier-protein] synthase II
VADLEAARPSGADMRRADRLGSLVVSATSMAFRDAGLRITAGNQYDVGIIHGTSTGPLASARRFFEPVAGATGQRTNPSIFPSTVCNAGAGLAATSLRIRGPNVALSAGQAGGLAALCCGYDLIRGGVATTLIAGGADELEASTLECYAAVRRIAPHETGHGEERSAPFGARASGMVLGEGGVFLVLEALDSALARGARIYAEILGWAGNGDRAVRRGADPSGEGAAHCMEAALRDAGVSANQIDVVASGAMSSKLHDRIEARALRQVFSSHRVPVTALSKQVGVCAATATLAGAAVILGMAENFIPGSPTLDLLDPECDVDLFDGPASLGQVDTALITASALGGSNYALVLQRWAE